MTSEGSLSRSLVQDGITAHPAEVVDRIAEETLDTAPAADEETLRSVTCLSTQADDEFGQ